MSAPAGHAATSQVEKLLRVVRENGASEMRLSADAAPMLLINGSMRPLKSRPLTEAEVSGLAASVMPSGADPESFSFDSSQGGCTGAVLDNDGTKVLILRPGNRTQSVGAIPPPPRPSAAAGRGRAAARRGRAAAGRRPTPPWTVVARR